MPIATDTTGSLEEWTVVSSNPFFTLEQREVPTGLGKLKNSADLSTKRSECYCIRASGDMHNAPILLLSGSSWNEMKECWNWIEQNMLKNMTNFINKESLVNNSSDSTKTIQNTSDSTNRIQIEKKTLQLILKDYFEKEYKKLKKIEEHKLISNSFFFNRLCKLKMLTLDEGLQENIAFISASNLIINSIEGNDEFNFVYSLDNSTIGTLVHKQFSGTICLTQKYLLLLLNPNNGIKITFQQIQNVQLIKNEIIIKVQSILIIISVDSIEQLFTLLVQNCNNSLASSNSLSNISTINYYFLNNFWMLNDFDNYFECNCIGIDDWIDTKGYLYFTSSFLCFCSTKESFVSFVLPFPQIKKCFLKTKDFLLFIKREEIVIETNQRKSFLIESKEKDLIYELIQTRIKDNYKLKTTIQTEKNSFKSQSTCSTILIKTPLLYEKIRFQGIPEQEKGRLWPLLCCIYKDSELPNEIEFDNLIKESDKITCIQFDEIERDLKRSLPTHPLYQGENGINKLRQVLRVFAFKHPAIGYVQGMNIITANLLLYLSSHTALATLECLLIDAFKEQYCDSLLGSVIDQKVFEQLLQENFPKVHLKFKQFSVQINMITISWFVCLFLSVLPTIETCSWWLDCLFLEGPLLMFKFALSVFETNSCLIEEAKDDDEVVQIIKGYFNSTRFSLLRLIQLSTSKKYSKLIDSKRITELRNHYRTCTVEEIRKTEQNITVRKIKEQFPLLSNQEIELILMTIRKIFLLEGKTNIEEGNISFVSFVEILKYILPEWYNTCPNSSSLFHLIYKRTNYLIVFELFQLLRKGRLRDKLSFLFDLHQTKDGLFDWELFTKSMSNYLSIDGELASEIKMVKNFDEFINVCTKSIQFIKLFEEK